MNARAGYSMGSEKDVMLVECSGSWPTVLLLEKRSPFEFKCPDLYVATLSPFKGKVFLNVSAYADIPCH